MYAAGWGVSILPASLNADKKVRLVAGQTQVLTLVLHADQQVTARGAEHNIGFALDLPAGFEAIYNKGYYKLVQGEVSREGGRNITKYDAKISNAFITGAPGSPINSEWRVHSIFIKTPQQMPPGDDHLNITITDGGAIQVFRWPVSLQSIAAPAARPRRTTFGLWDYNFFRSNDAATSEGLARFYNDSGIGFTHYSAYDVYQNALRKQGILAGGNTLNASFYSPELQDAEASGRILEDDYANPRAVINLPKGAAIPGVKQLLIHARQCDNIATFDFEPDGVHGFGEASIKEFKKRNKLSDADFARFRTYVGEHRLTTFQSTDPFIARTWRLWTNFRSEEVAGYTRRIYQDLKAQAPDVKLAITTRSANGKDSASTLAIGTDNAAVAANADIVMPQIYCGYGGANAKQAMQTTARWVGELRRQNSRAELWPLLLARYAGASVYNSPTRLRQQAIGSLAQGAKGIVFYYPGNMDAPYWDMTARLNEDVSKYEDFYLDGKRVDERYKLSELPKGTTQVNMWPGYSVDVQNPAWSFTAHELNGKVLLTLINLEEANDLLFGIEVGEVRLSATQDAELIKGRRDETGAFTANKPQLKGTAQWLVAPGKIGFIILEGGTAL